MKKKSRDKNVSRSRRRKPEPKPVPVKMPRLNREHIVQIKVNRRELAAMKVNADKWADGNLSVWLRYAGIKLSPLKEDLEEIEVDEAS